MGRHSHTAPSSGAPKSVWIMAIVAIVIAASYGTFALVNQGASTATDGSQSQDSPDAAGEHPDSLGSAVRTDPNISVQGAGEGQNALDSGATPTQSAPATFLADTPAATNGAKPCITVPVLASDANETMLRALAVAYQDKPRDIDGHCVTISVTSETVSAAAQAASAGFADTPQGAKPVIWAPDSAIWLTQARSSSATGSAIIPEMDTPFANTAIVLAVPQQAADALGWVAEPPTWQQVISAASDAHLWDESDHPQWAPFRLTKSSPLVNTSGLMAQLTEFGVAAGAVSIVTPATVGNDKMVERVKEIERGLRPDTTTPQRFLQNLRQAQDADTTPATLPAAILNESHILEYNQGITVPDGTTTKKLPPPTQRLVPIYPTDGVYEAVSTAATLTGDWISDDQAHAAADFTRFITSVEGQRIVRISGFRDFHGGLSDTAIEIGRYTPTPATLATPDIDTVAAAQDAFTDVRTHARILFLVDVSGSMGNYINPEQTRLDAAVAAVKTSLTYLTDDDEVGLAAFSNYDGGDITPGQLASVAPLGSSADDFSAALAELKPISQTPLYRAVIDYTDIMAEDYDPDKINVIVLLSDGLNDTSDTTKRQTMLDALAKNRQGATPVMVYSLAYSAAADTETLQKIANASGAEYYDATDPTTISSVLSDLITSF